MRKHTLIIIILVSAFLFPQPSIDLVEGGDVEHISLIIYEDLINEFFSNMGKIKKKEKNYEWALKNPRISIKDKKAIFEMTHTTVIRVEESAVNKEELKKIFLSDVPTEVYPEVEKKFFEIVKQIGYPQIKLGEKINFKEQFEKNQK